MNIGLVLSGGMAKGAYQVGALQALSEIIPFDEIKYVSCSSVGVLNGYAYVTDSLNHVEQMWKNICENDARIFISRILKSSILQQNIVNLYDPKKTIQPAFYCSLLDLSNRNILYKNLSSVDNEDIPLYLKASVAMPVYNRSVRIDNTYYLDGAMIDNVPVYPLLRHNVDYIICVYFDDTCYKFENTYFDNKIVKITFPSKNVLKQSVMFNHDGICEMIENGYDRTSHILKSVFSEGYENLDYIYQAINYMNESCKNKSLRITGDVIVDNLNKITQRLTKRKIL